MLHQETARGSGWRVPIAAITVLIGVLLLGQPAKGQGVIIVDRIFMPQPPPQPVPPLRMDDVKVDTEIRDLAATTRVEQVFHNPFGHRIEGTFLFPLPEGAAVTDFSMTVGGEIVGGELLDAARAREIYEAIVRRQRDPGLLEYIGRELFRARVFPIEANERKRLVLEYTHALDADNGLAKYVFPLKVRGGVNPNWPGPWPPPWPPQPMPLERPAPVPPSSPVNARDLTVRVRIANQAGVASAYSPTHDIDVNRVSDDEVVVGYENTGRPPDEDFVLYYQFSNRDFGLNLVTHRDPGEERGYFMMLLAPKADIREDEIVAKDILFVFDVSGSMKGDKVEQAQKALVYSLQSLNPGDRFNVIAFSTDLRSFEAGLVTADADKVAEAVTWVNDLRAAGGTNIDEALKRALSQLPEDTGRPAMVLFLTDGQPTVGETNVNTILEHVERANDAEARVFAFGVGNDLNAVLLDRLTEQRGARAYVRPGEDIEVAVSNLYEKIAYPVLGDLRLDVRGVTVENLHPGVLPDLFKGSQVTVFGRYRGAGTATVVLRGTANGQEQVFEYSADLPERERGNGYVPRLWATRRVGYLLEQIRLHGESRELKEEVVELATRYGILTPYTSWLVLEPGMRNEPAVVAALRRPEEHLGLMGPVGEPGRAGPAGPQGPQGPPGQGGFGGGVAAPPSSDASGEGAILRSQGEREMRDADSAEDLAGAVPSQQAAGRTFYRLNDGWVDSTVPEDTTGLRVVRVKYLSDAYFDLLDLRPELREILALGPVVQARFGEVLLVVAEEAGDEALKAEDRQALTEV